MDEYRRARREACEDVADQLASEIARLERFGKRREAREAAEAEISAELRRRNDELALQLAATRETTSRLPERDAERDAERQIAPVAAREERAPSRWRSVEALSPSPPPDPEPGPAPAPASARAAAAEPQEPGRVRPREEWAPLVGVRKSWRELSEESSLTAVPMAISRQDSGRYRAASPSRTRAASPPARRPSPSSWEPSSPPSSPGANSSRRLQEQGQESSSPPSPPDSASSRLRTASQPDAAATAAEDEEDAPWRSFLSDGGGARAVWGRPEPARTVEPSARGALSPRRAVSLGSSTAASASTSRARTGGGGGVGARMSMDRAGVEWAERVDGALSELSATHRSDAIKLRRQLAEVESVSIDSRRRTLSPARSDSAPPSFYSSAAAARVSASSSPSRSSAAAEIDFSGAGAASGRGGGASASSFYVSPLTGAPSPRRSVLAGAISRTSSASASSYKSPRAATAAARSSRGGGGGGMPQLFLSIDLQRPSGAAPAEIRSSSRLRSPGRSSSSSSGSPGRSYSGHSASRASLGDYLASSSFSSHSDSMMTTTTPAAAAEASERTRQLVAR